MGRHRARIDAETSGVLVWLAGTVAGFSLLAVIVAHDVRTESRGAGVVVTSPDARPDTVTP
ncbi:hypothetical protein [Streptomyces luteireticuli]|uniref:hypothetical protein n=1 Tax=Streptomyces luteireticuli TaxID=173858 RepID=UPI003558C336